MSLKAAHTTAGKKIKYLFSSMFNVVAEFEEKIAAYFGAPYAVAVDCCTHGIELCLRLFNVKEITVPKRTYISIPFLADKLQISLSWKDEKWVDYYCLTDTSLPLKVIDAAVLWEPASYIAGSYMCVSFQFQKHLSLGRGGVVLTDNAMHAELLKRMSYDGRVPDMPWREQDIPIVGYHYYMTPETAQMGLEKLPAAIETNPRQWEIEDWPDVSKMRVFN